MSIASVDTNIKVLVVDDYALTRDMVKSILRQLGFQNIQNIVGVEDGVLALQVIREEKVGLVICDWNMPRLSGLAVLREVRSRERDKDLPFLMLTAEAYRENVVEAMKAGVSDYVVKPFTSSALADKIAHVLAPKQTKPAG
jgi:two-component system, chemotaxis family, chemotaxis protein CheY